MTHVELLRKISKSQRKSNDFISLGAYPSNSTLELEKICKELKSEGYIEYKIPYQGTFFARSTGYIDGTTEVLTTSIPADNGNLEVKILLKGKEFLKSKRKKFNPAWIIMIVAIISLCIVIYVNFLKK